MYFNFKFNVFKINSNYNEKRRKHVNSFVK